jgi:molybdate transport system permease protein
MNNPEFKQNKPNTWWVSAGMIPTTIYLAFILIPILALVIRVAQEGQFLPSLGNEQVITAMRLSMITSLISVTVTLLVGTPFAYFMANTRFPGQRIVDVLIELPLLMPPVAAGLAMLMAFGRRGILGNILDTAGLRIPFTFVAVIFAQVFVAAPFYIRSARIGFQGIDRTYYDLSLTLGHSPWRTFWSTSVPLAMPSLIGGVVLSWARAISEFGATLVFAGNFPGRTQTMPLAIIGALESELSHALALALILLAMSAIVLIATTLIGSMWLRSRQ